MEGQNTEGHGSSRRGPLAGADAALLVLLVLLVSRHGSSRRVMSRSS